MQDTMEHGEGTSGILKDVASKWSPLKSYALQDGRRMPLGEGVLCERLGNRRKASMVIQEMTDSRLQAKQGDRQGWRDQQRSDHVGFSRL